MELTEEELQAYDRLSDETAASPVWGELLREAVAAIVAEGYGFDEEGRVVPLDPSLPENPADALRDKYPNIHTSARTT